MSQPEILGVRHHSPACARLVENKIRASRPRFVLIEGPSDLNERLDELALPHTLPIAAFSFLQTESQSLASWSPFCEYSPEWVALSVGREVGSDVRFIDLPAWAQPRTGPSELVNAYSDGGAHTSAYVAALCAELNIEGMDNLWDHLFEQPMELSVLEARLASYFEKLRNDQPAGEDEKREAFMAAYIGWAMQSEKDAHEVGENSGVLVVCGGWHKPALETLWTTTHGKLPEPEQAAENVRLGTYLVPYSHERLDSFTGYQSGMPSPAWHRAVWRGGAVEAQETTLRNAVLALRQRKIAVSAADLIGATSMTEGLMRLRGHQVPTRADLLDGLASALLEEAQPERFPWNERRGIRAGTDPRLALVLQLMRGEARGQLAEGTPAPPLVLDIEDRLLQLAAGPLGKLTKASRPIKLDLTADRTREVSAFLHRLRVLSIPGFLRSRGPAWATDGELHEHWDVRDHMDRRAKSIEASMFGGTLEQATRECLRRRGGDVSRLVTTLGDAVFCDLKQFASLLLSELERAVSEEPRLGPLANALTKLLGLYRHDVLFGVKGNEALGGLIEAVVARSLWLIEGLVGPQSGESEGADGGVAAIYALRETCRHTGLGDPLRVQAVLERRLIETDVPPAVVGASLGYLWSENLISEGEEAVQVIRAFGRAETLGSFLHGLFQLARAEVREDAATIEALDDMIGSMTDEDFLVAIPTLRLAFSVFPTRERATLAAHLVARYGAGAHGVVAPLTADAWVLQDAAALEAALDRIEAAEGLSPIDAGDAA